MTGERVPGSMPGSDRTAWIAQGDQYRAHAAEHVDGLIGHARAALAKGADPVEVFGGLAGGFMLGVAVSGPTSAAFIAAEAMMRLVVQPVEVPSE